MLKRIFIFLIVLNTVVFASEPIPGKLLIKLTAGTNIENVVTQIPYTVIKYIHRSTSFKSNEPEIEKTYMLKFSESEDIKAVAKTVEKIPGVKWTSLDYVVTPIPTNPNNMKANRIINGQD